eukprot:12118418-Alexandrium_andersonii.AAC.1
MAKAVNMRTQSLPASSARSSGLLVSLCQGRTLRRSWLSIKMTHMYTVVWVDCTDAGGDRSRRGR